jgi:hypothetical protein
MMKSDTSSQSHNSLRLLMALAIVIATPLLRAQGFTSTGGVTSTSDSVQIGATLPVQGKLHIFSATDNTVLALYSRTSLTNAVKFEDISVLDPGSQYGVVADFQGNSAIKMGSMRIGFQGYPYIMSLDGQPLQFNSVGVLGFAPGDVVVGGTGLANGLRVNGSGNSSFAGSVGIGTTSPLRPLSFANTIGEKISLYSSSSTPQDYYGFGVAGAELQYQAPAGAHHSFYVGTLEKVRIDASGNVGIGGNLTVNGTIVSSSQSPTSFSGGVSIATTAAQQALNVSGYASASTGSVLQIAGTAAAGSYQNQLNVTSAANNWGLIIGQNNNVSPSGYHCAGCAHIVNYNNAALVLGTNNTDRMRIDGAGHVGIPTANPLYTLDVTGDAHFSGTVSGGLIQATYQDVAEWVPAGGALSSGTVVVLNRLKSNEVTPSAKSYDTAVAGVVSDEPGMLLGVAGPNKAKIATTGRVKVRVDARKHPVTIGDLLVTSDTVGAAMLSEPLDINGRKFHQPGTLIGKALEPLSGGEGEILVLLSLQ